MNGRFAIRFDKAFGDQPCSIAILSRRAAEKGPSFDGRTLFNGRVFSVDQSAKREANRCG